MPKTTSYTRVQNITLTIRLNERVSLPAMDDQSPADGFVPVTIVTNMQAVDGLGGVRDIQQQTQVGSVRETEYTPSELATLVKGSGNSTGNFLLAELTKAYNDAIGGLA